MLLANSNWATINTSSAVIFCSKPAFFAILKTVFRIRQQHRSGLRNARLKRGEAVKKLGLRKKTAKTKRAQNLTIRFNYKDIAVQN